MIAASTGLTDILRVLGDPTRLRILGLLELDELSVGELARALEMAQSRVSNHLRVLRDASLLSERHAGRTTYLQLAIGAPDDASAPASPSGLSLRLWHALRAEIPLLPEFAADVERLAQVIAERRAQSRDFFDRVAGEWDKLGVDFQSGQARQRVAAALLPRGLTIADLGCGTGYLSRALLGLCERLVCVDRSAGMLAQARSKLEPVPPGMQIDLRQGELDHLPIADAELDGCVAGMVLHHLPAPDAALREMLRVLKPDGRAVVLELAPHHETWMHTALGDRHLGLDPRDVLNAFTRAGFVDVRLESVDDRYQPRPDSSDREDVDRSSVSLPLYIVRGRTPHAA